MKLTEKRIQYSDGKTFKGRKNKFEVTISFVPKSTFHKMEFWNYLLEQKETDFSYNSQCDNHRYSTLEECANAAEQKIDELKKQK